MSKYTEERDKYQNDVRHLYDDSKMKKLVEKLLVFDKLIDLLVQWKIENNEQKEEEVLKDLTFIPLMKCLYIVCLLSVHKTKQETLFEVFDKFMAYQYGPVDEDCYYSIDELPHYQINDNEVITKREGDGEQLFIDKFELTKAFYSSTLNKLNTNIFKMLEEAVTDLKNALYFPSFKEKDNLIDLTHRELWEKAYRPDKFGVIDLNDKFALLKEARDIRSVIAA